MSLPNDEFPELDDMPSDLGTGGDGEAPEENQELPDDWTQDPRYQSIQSSMQKGFNKQLEPLLQRLAELEKTATTESMTRQQVERELQVTREAIRNLGSESDVQLVENMTELERLRTFREQVEEREKKREQQTQAQQAAAQWRSNKEMQISALGLNAYDPTIQRAIDATLATGDDGHVIKAIGDLMNKKSAGQNASSDGEISRQRPQPGVRPPSGGVARPNDQNRLRAQYDAEMAKAKRGSPEIPNIRRKYRRMGLEGI